MWWILKHTAIFQTWINILQIIMIFYTRIVKDRLSLLTTHLRGNSCFIVSGILLARNTNGIGWLICHPSTPVVLPNTLRLRQNGRHFPDDIFKCIFLNENVRISIEISLKFVPKGPINNIPPLIQIMAWCQWGDKPLSEPMMVSLPTHICVTRPQWVNQDSEESCLFITHFQYCFNIG